MRSSEWRANVPTVIELAQADTRLHRVSREYHGACPMPGCTCDNDGFRVMPEKNRWACRGCCPRGDTVVGYLMKRDDIGYVAACHKLGLQPGKGVPLAPARAERLVGIEPSTEWREAAGDVVCWTGAPFRLSCRQGKPALFNLHGRGLTDDTIGLAGLGYLDGGLWDISARRGLWVPSPAIVIPWRANGALWQVKLRLLNPIKLANRDELRYLPLTWTDRARRETHPAGQPHLYGANTLAGRDVAILCEGELDTVLLWQEVGDLVGVCTLGSCSASIPARAAAYLLPMRRIFVAYDTDEAGQKAARDLVKRYPGLPMEVVQVPISSSQGKDIGDFHRAGGSLRDWARYLLMGGCMKRDVPGPRKQQSKIILHARKREELQLYERNDGN